MSRFAANHRNKQFSKCFERFTAPVQARPEGGGRGDRDRFGGCRRWPAEAPQAGPKSPNRLAQSEDMGSCETAEQANRPRALWRFGSPSPAKWGRIRGPSPPPV